MNSWRLRASELAHPFPADRLTGGIATQTSTDLPASPRTVRPRTVELLRRPLALLWDRRQAISPLPGQAHITVPLTGGPPRAEAAARVTRYLEQMWVQNPVATSIEVTSVATSIVADQAPGAVAPYRLILMLTFDDKGADSGIQQLDTAHMARHLETAVSQLA